MAEAARGWTSVQTPDGLTADLNPFWDQEKKEYHLFYLKANTNASGWPRWQTPWSHIASTARGDVGLGRGTLT